MLADNDSKRLDDIARGIVIEETTDPDNFIENLGGKPKPKHARKK